jgi:hypothetical protein
MQRLRDGESRTIRVGTPPSIENGDTVDEQPVPFVPAVCAVPALNEDTVGELYGEF